MKKFSATGFGEFFKPTSTLPDMTTVVLDNGTVRKCLPYETPIGVISEEIKFTGDVDNIDTSHRFLLDENGEPVVEYVDLIEYEIHDNQADHTGKRKYYADDDIPEHITVITEISREKDYPRNVKNPNYRQHIDKKDVVGVLLVGVGRVLKGEVISSSWQLLHTSKKYDYYLVYPQTPISNAFGMMEMDIEDNQLQNYYLNKLDSMFYPVYNALMLKHCFDGMIQEEVVDYYVEDRPEELSAFPFLDERSKELGVPGRQLAESIVVNQKLSTSFIAKLDALRVGAEYSIKHCNGKVDLEECFNSYVTRFNELTQDGYRH